MLRPPRGSGAGAESKAGEMRRLGNVDKHHAVDWKAVGVFLTLPVILVVSGETLNFVWARLVGLPATLIFTVVAVLLFFSTRSVRNTPVRGM